MKFSDYFKKNKTFFISVLVVVVFFGYLMINQYLKIEQLDKQYRDEIENLRSLVDVTNIGEASEIEFDIYQSAEKFLSYYYGLSGEITPEYRETQLKQLMTEDAFNKYGLEEYNNTIGCEITISNTQIYVDYKNSSKESVYVCVFFDENIDWPKINIITVKKYWKGCFTYDESLEEYVLDDIVECQELLTREEFNALNVDTNGSVLEKSDVEGSDEDAVAGKGTQEDS